MTKPVEKFLSVTARDVGFDLHRDRSLRKAVCDLLEVPLKTSRCHDENATTLRTDRVPVGRTARHEDKRSRRPKESIPAAANLVFAIEHVKGLIAPWMSMESGSDLGRMHHFDHRVRGARGVPDLDVHARAAKENLAPSAGREGVGGSIRHALPVSRFMGWSF